MAKIIKLNDLPASRTLDSQALGRIHGGALASGFLFRSRPRSMQPSINFNIENFEVNNYDITNYIDQLVQQTNNQLQLSTINVEAGDAAAINILSDQGLNGSNSSSIE